MAKELGEKQCFSDYRLLTNFDLTLVVVTTDSRLQGFGEAKADVSSSGSCTSILSCIENEIKPILIGKDTRHISRIWEHIYNITRDHNALSRGRKFPILGRRGLTISTMSEIATALWDLKGKALGVPVPETNDTITKHPESHITPM